MLITLAACLFSYKFGSVLVAHAQSLPPSPETWSVTAYGGAGQTVSISQPAGGTGVQHVVTCIMATYYNTTVGTKTAAELVFLRNGPSGTGPILLQWPFEVAVGATGSVNLCGLNLVGSPNTAMTLEFPGNQSTSAGEVLSMIGYDAQ